MITKNRCREFWNPVIFRYLLFFNHITYTRYPDSIQISQGCFFLISQHGEAALSPFNRPHSVEGNAILT